MPVRIAPRPRLIVTPELSIPIGATTILTRGDRDKAHVLSACAGDWLEGQVSVDAREAQGQNVHRMGYGRLKYVTREWQLFGWTNLSEAQIRANPPPLIGLPK